MFAGTTYDQATEDRLLSKHARGYWTGYQVGAKDGDPYRFWVVGPGSSGAKRNPYARELSPLGFPKCNSILRASNAYPWHDAGFQTPDFADMVIYQLHVGTYAISKAGVCSNLLDVIGKIPYIAALGCNVLQPLPVDEQEDHPAMGYGGTDLFSPDFPYIAPSSDLPQYLVTINDLLEAKDLEPMELEDIASAPAQVKVLVDLCHVYGIAVAFDVVYNHAGGFSVDGQFDDNCAYYFDRMNNVGNNNDSLYFTDQDRGTGGLAFALWNDDVAQMLLDNARMYLEEFHGDGFRYDEISILLSTSQGTGWDFCRRLTSQNRALQPRVLQNAEFWPGEFSDIPTIVTPIVSPADQGGAGFDVVQHDALRGALRTAIEAVSHGAAASVSMSAIAAVLYPPGLDYPWRAVTCVENHDLVFSGRNPRIPALADGSDVRSWYARSRTRFAMGVLLTSPGIPQLFMGQEFLEEKPWNTDPKGPDLIGWAGLKADTRMSDHLRFSQDLVRLRMSYPSLRGGSVNSFYSSDADRVIAYQRWIEGIGEDVVVIATLAESTWWSYRIGFPGGGFWKEVFNSDVYDGWVNPAVAGNGGGVSADGPPMHGFNTSATVVIPANGVVVFARG